MSSIYLSFCHLLSTNIYIYNIYMCVCVWIFLYYIYFLNFHIYNMHLFLDMILQCLISIELHGATHAHTHTNVYLASPSMRFSMHGWGEGILPKSPWSLLVVNQGKWFSNFHLRRYQNRVVLSIFVFTPNLGVSWSNLTSIILKWVAQPPTRSSIGIAMVLIDSHMTWLLST